MECRSSFRSSLISLSVTPSAAARPRAARATRLLEAVVRPALLWLVAATALSGCSDTLRPADDATHYSSTGRIDRNGPAATVRDVELSGRMLYGALPKAHEPYEQRARRVKVDTARNRLWVLGLDDVHVYDILGKRLIRQVTLPERSVAHSLCPPDMTLDRSGAAFISSNADARLWKIDAENFSIQEHEIRLHGKEGWDIGFGALAFAADGTLFALTAHGGSLWRIDMAKSSANEVELSERVLNACALMTPRETVQSAQERTVVLCAAGEKDSRRILITPDLARGHVSDEKCPS